MPLSEISKKIISLRWEKKFEEVLEIYRNDVHGRFSVAEIVCSVKLVTAVTDSLKETGKPGAGIHFMEDSLKIVPADNTPDELIKNLGWIYFFAFKAQPVQVVFNSDKRKLNFIFLLKQFQKRSESFLFESLFFSCLNTLLRRFPFEADYAENLLKEFDASHFSRRGEKRTIMVGGKTKEAEMACGYEKYVIIQSKIFYNLQKYDECIDTCRKALATVDKFHHGNQIWIARRMALCFKQLGDFSLAEHEFEKFIKRKNDWFIQKELAELYSISGAADKALQLGAKAILNGGYSAYKVGLIEFMGEILNKKKQTLAAMDFYRCASVIRKENNWPVPHAISQMLNKKFESTNESGEGLFRKVINYAITYDQSASLQERYHGKGKITRILHEGENGDGFITCSQNQSVYFRFCNTRIPWQTIQNGCLVSFVAIKTEQKGKAAFKAIKVFPCTEEKEQL